MLQKASEAVSEVNGPIHQEEEYGFGRLAPVDGFREIKSLLREQEKMLKELRDDLKDGMKRLIEHYAARLEQDARQPRLAMEADGPANTKTRERTEGAATAVQAMRGDDFSASWVEPGTNNNSTSFGVKVEPPALPCRDDVMVESGAATSESCVPSLEMRSSSAAGGLVPPGEASTAKRTNFNQPPIRFCSTEETDLEPNCKKTSIPYASFDSSSFWRLLAAPYCRRIVDTKSRQNRTFDPGGSRGHLRACPVLGSWRALVCGEVIRAGAAGDELQRFFGGDSLAL